MSSGITFAQNYSDTSRYSEIILDGKTAYIDVKTGAIIVPNKTVTPQPVKTVTTTTTVPKQTGYSTVYTQPTNHPIQKGSYTVYSGDTLYSIAKRYGMKASELARINGISTSTALSIGQRLIVHPMKNPSPTKSSDGRNFYYVRKGDTLYSIARKNGLSAQQLAAQNSISINSTLGIGQRLTIPQGSTSTNDSTTVKSTYTVKPGDTLYSIAKRKGITVYELKRLNNLKSNSLSVGKRLRIR